MLKRTKGRVLILLLVVTGLAGQVANSNIINTEKQQAVKTLKQSRDAYLKSVKGLSNEQFTFKPIKDQWSVKECILHLAVAEESLWNRVEISFLQPPDIDKRTGNRLTDEEVMHLMRNKEHEINFLPLFEPGSAPWSTAENALNHFKQERKKGITYIKTNTRDFRNHIVEMPSGNLDAYQMVLLIAYHTNQHTQQIKEIKARPDFPMK